MKKQRSVGGAMLIKSGEGKEKLLVSAACLCKKNSNSLLSIYIIIMPSGQNVGQRQ